MLTFLAIPTIGHSALTKFWISNGGYKVPMDDMPPTTTNANWNGTTASTFGGRNETVSLVLFIGNDTASDVSQVSVLMSSLSGPSGSSIASVAVSSMNVWDTTTRPIEKFFVRYLPIQGMTQLSWDGTEYDQGHLPERFKRPCTMSGDQCSPNGGTLWTDRTDHGKYYPEILVPYEAIEASSFTVHASSSQAVWFDIYLGKTLASGLYTGTITVKEGVSTSTTIPVSVRVRNYELPDEPSFKTMAYMSNYNIAYRHHGEHFPSHETEPYLTTRKRYMQMLHRHGVTPIGDDNVTSESPYSDHVMALNGTLYANATGYGNARGVGTGDKVYSIGTYASWQGSWGTTDATDFCTHVSSWTNYFKDNYPSVRSFLYIADETLTNVEKFATWMSTKTDCRVDGYKVNSFVTYNWPSIQSSAPHIDMPCTTTWIGVSSTTWQTAADAYITNGTTQAWAYTSHPPWTGSIFATEDDGTAPITIPWSAYKMGVQGWFFWESTYWTDSNNESNDVDVWNDAMTFGYYTSADPIKGRTGFQYSNGDGVLMYPGTDSVHADDSYGIQAPFASWRLKMLRRGIQDADYMTLAYAADPAATDAIVSAAVPEVLWEYHCYTLGDCTYGYGPRSFSDDPDDWEAARSDLGDLFEGTGTGISGGFRLSGGATVR
jgi:hypothetical protein